jgi:hypothetical protein
MESTGADTTFRAQNPATGEPFGPAFPEAT